MSLSKTQHEVLNLFGYTYDPKDGFLLNGQKLHITYEIAPIVQDKYGDCLTIIDDEFIVKYRPDYAPATLDIRDWIEKGKRQVSGSLTFEDKHTPTLFFTLVINGEQANYYMGEIKLYYYPKKNKKKKKAAQEEREEKKYISLGLTADGPRFSDNDDWMGFYHTENKLDIQTTKDFMKPFREYLKREEHYIALNLRYRENTINKFWECFELYLGELVLAYHQHMDRMIEYHKRTIINQIRSGNNMIGRLRRWDNCSEMSGFPKPDTSHIPNNRALYKDTNISVYKVQILKELGIDILETAEREEQIYENVPAKTYDVMYNGNILKSRKRWDGCGHALEFLDKSRNDGTEEIVLSYNLEWNSMFARSNGISLRIGGGQNYFELCWNGLYFGISPRIYDSLHEEEGSWTFGEIRLACSSDSPRDVQSTELKQFTTFTRININNEVKPWPIAECSYARYIEHFETIIANFISKNRYGDSLREKDTVDIVKRIAHTIFKLYISQLTLTYEANLPLLMAMYNMEVAQQQAVWNDIISRAQDNIRKSREAAKDIGEAFKLSLSGTMKPPKYQ